MSAPILVLSLATTDGWVVNERELTAGLGRLGVPHRVARLRLGPEAHLRRTGFLPLVDAIEAAGSRRALNAGLRSGDVSAVIALSTTAALLAPVRRLRGAGIPVAIRIDCPSSISRPGPQNAVQRALERRRLAESTLTIGTGPRSAELLAPLAAEVAVLPVPVDAAREGAAAANGDGDVVTYSADPDNKGLDLICRAWWQLGAAVEGRHLHVTGVSPERGRRHLTRKGVAEPPGLTWHGDLEREEHLSLLRGAAAYVSASSWEGAGIAQLEALAAGVPLVTTPSLGAYEAHPIAVALRPFLATATRDADELASALGAALAMGREERAAYAEQAARAVEGFGTAAADRALAEDVLPRLGASPDAARA